MAQQATQSERRKQKMQLILELKEYIDAQKLVLYNEYMELRGNVGEKETDKAKRARKVYETVNNFK